MELEERQENRCESISLYPFISTRSDDAVDHSLGKSAVVSFPLPDKVTISKDEGVELDINGYIYQQTFTRQCFIYRTSRVVSLYIK